MNSTVRESTPLELECTAVELLHDDDAQQRKGFFLGGGRSSMGSARLPTQRLILSLLVNSIHRLSIFLVHAERLAAASPGRSSRDGLTALRG